MITLTYYALTTTLIISFYENQNNMEISKIYILGDESQAGTYVLKIRLYKNTNLKFGGFKKGKLISLLEGHYTYVGSALSEKGSTSLARRLVRHATRTSPKPHHKIRDDMLLHFQVCGLGPPDPLPKNGKKLYWNIDYLLDLEVAEIINVIAIRSTQRLESTIGKYLENRKDTQIIEKGLGANDSPNNTYILRMNTDDVKWLSISDDIHSQFL